MNVNFTIKDTSFSLILLLIIFLLINSGCRNKGHHLLEDVTKKIRHEDDTVGWSSTLESLHGVWVHQKYMNHLNSKRSIYEANQLLPSTFSIINIDTRKFISDSLEFVALNARDSKNWKSCIYFGKSKGKIFMELTTQHPVFKSNDVVLSFSLEPMEFATHLNLKQSFGDGISDRDRFIKVTEDVSDKEYDYDPLIGVEIYMRKFLKGRYDVYDANNRLLKRNIIFSDNGTIDNHPFAKYRMLPWYGFDALMIQGMTFQEEQLNSNNKHYGLIFIDNGLELYQITTNSKKQVIMGELKFVLQKR